jgi:two-component system phosphate regulon sensor histidine kinase PhoR
MPSAITLSSSTIRTLAIARTIDPRTGHSRFRNGDDLVKRFFRGKPSEPDGEVEAAVQTQPPAIADHIYTSSFDELRTGFTAAVSHELRTPLARILALLDLTDLPGADVPDLIDQARAEVENAGALIDEILFLSELESGREIVSLGHTQALPVLEGVARELEGAALRAGVEVIVEGDEDVDLPLRPRMLRMVVENLAENAIRYAGHGACFTLSIRRAGEFAVLTAADDGQGVAEQTLPRLFERFYRTDSARTSRGTGLGLAIVKHVVAAAGGDVEAEGGPGRGLRIRCTFPA